MSEIKVVKAEAETEIRSVGFEELNERLLKNKFDLGELYRQKEERRLENRDFYMQKLLDFVANVKGYLSNCYYKDDIHVKEIINYLNIQIGLIDTEQVILLRTEKDKANKQEVDFYEN